MSNSNERSNIIINSETFSTDQSSASVSQVSNTGSRVSQLVNNVSISNLIQSNSFLHSDLGILIETPQNITNNATRQVFSNTNQSRSHAPEHVNQTVVDLQDSNNMLPEATEEIDATLDQANTTDGSRNIIYFLFSSLQSSFPFFLFLIAKIFHQHLLGFFIVLGFMTTLHWSNKSLVHQVELRDRKQNVRLALLIIFLLFNALIFFIIFNEYELYKCLVFMEPKVKKMDIWNLIWIVVCSDTIIKYMTISLKALITLLPFKIMPLRKRGVYYSIVETSAQFYRSLTPIHPWILFIFYAETSKQIMDNGRIAETQPVKDQESTYFEIILCLFYIICKLNQLWAMFKELMISFLEMKNGMSSMPIKHVVTENEDNICPICQDKLASPVVLKCQHIFCEDCVCVWLDKENSCPMCRAKIAVKKPQFKDGSTTIFIQWY